MMRHRTVLIAFFLTTASVFLTGFSIIPASHAALFTLLLGLFAIPIIYALSGDVRPIPALVFVLTTPVVPMLLVIDPLEIGLWGHDPYIHSMTALKRISAGNLDSAMQVGSYPGTYLLVDTLSTILGLSLEDVAKYIPLITSTVPLFLYLTTKRWVGRSNALIIAIIAASTRTLLGFESKFVDEILAVTLAFVLIALIPIYRTRVQQLTAIVVMGALTLSHHAVSFFLILGLSLWWVSGDALQKLSQLPVVGQIIARFAPYKSTTITLPVVLALALFGLIIPLYFGQRFLGLVLINLINAFSGQTSSLSGGGVSAAPEGVFAVVSSFLTLSLIVLTFFSLWSIYRTPSAEWEVGWLAFVGCLGMLYAVSLVAGRIVPLDPTRLLIFIVPLLAAVAITQLSGRPARWRSVGIIAITALLIIPNLAAISPHLLISDTGHKPDTSEGHFTESQWAASQWAASSNPDTIAALERDLWAATGNEYIANEYGSCGSETFVARSGLQQPNETDNVIYSNGDVRLWRCW